MRSAAQLRHVYVYVYVYDDGSPQSPSCGEDVDTGPSASEAAQGI
jgi:hypothetical protein